MYKSFSQSNIVVFVLLFLFAMFFCLSFFAEATYDGGDGIRHYLVSRYSWKHPDLLLYSWGKPFFTILSSPFSQFGMIGMNVFNIICAITSSFICFKLSQKLNLKYPFLVILFLCFTPIYFPTINSGLTEPFFGLVLIFSIYLVFDKKFFWATILISFLPFVRSEGYLIFPLFLAVLIYRNKWKLFPLLAFGTVFYTIVGFFHYHDFLWLIHQNPYKGLNYNIYGQGEFLHFINEYDLILGISNGALFLLGLLSALIFLMHKRKIAYTKEGANAFTFEELLLIYGSFLAYFFAHTIFWWKGMGSSLGLIRVMAAIIPCSALICLRGFNLIMLPILIKNKFIEWFIIATISCHIIFSCFNYDFFPYKLNAETIVLKEAADWYKESSFTNKKVYYLYPYLAEALDIDPFEQSKVGELWGLYPSIKKWGASVVPDSAIVLWDGHFGPNEGNIELDSIIRDPNFELIKVFRPKKAFKTLGNYNFEVYVFMKLNSNNAHKKTTSLAYELYDLENPDVRLANTTTVFNFPQSHSGKKSWKLTSDLEFGVNIIRNISDIPPNTTEIQYNCMVLDEGNNTTDAKIVLSIDNKTGENLFWEGLQMKSPVATDSSGWKKFSVRYIVNPNSFPNESLLKFYIWNVSKKDFYVDDVELIYFGKK